jgi:hypothetical protein
MEQAVPRKRCTPEPIIYKMRGAQVVLAKSPRMAEVARKVKIL